ncbi:MAG: prepilin peptidase [Ilumatobacteraceae bacterium]
MSHLTTQDRTPPVAPAPAHAGVGRASAQVLLVIGLTAAAFGSIMVAALIGSAIAGIAAVLDARSGILPDRLIVASALPVVATLIHDGAHGHLAPTSTGIVLGIVAFAGPLFVAHVISPVAIGFGDVKLAGSLGAAVGLVDPAFALAGVCVATGLTAAIGLSTRRSVVALGPGLVIGAVVALVAAHHWSGPVQPWH